MAFGTGRELRFRDSLRRMNQGSITDQKILDNELKKPFDSNYTNSCVTKTILRYDGKTLFISLGLLLYLRTLGSAFRLKKRSLT